VAKGFLIGLTKGLVGLVVKPVSGVIDFTSKTAEGIKNSSKMLDFDNPKKLLNRRIRSPVIFYGA